MNEPIIKPLTIHKTISQKNVRLHVKIQSPEKVLFDDNVVAISSVNDVGPFDVLEMHANFITLIRDGIILYKTNKEVQRISCERGIMKVFENTVTIFLGIETIG